MNALTAARRDLAQALAQAGLDATSHPAARPAPPCLQVASLTIQGDGAPFGSWPVRVRIRCITRPADPATAADHLDDLVTTAVTALTETTDWAIESVGEPYTLVLTEAQTYPATDINATSIITL